MPDIFLYVKMGPKHFDIFFSYKSRALFGIYPTRSFIWHISNTKHRVHLFVSGICIHVSMATPTDLYVLVYYWTMDRYIHLSIF